MKNLQPTFRGGILPFTLLLFLVAWTHQASAGDYVIGPRDTLKITVWGQQDLSQNYNVSVEGTIVFPLIGEVRAAGLTEAQLGQKLVTLLEKDYLVNPQVMVSVAEYKSKKVLILGEAVKPGVVPLTGNTLGSSSSCCAPFSRWPAQAAWFQPETPSGGSVSRRSRRVTHPRTSRWKTETHSLSPRPTRSLSWAK